MVNSGNLNNVGKKRTKLFWNENKLEVYRLNQDQEVSPGRQQQQQPGVSPTNRNSVTSPVNKNNIDMTDVTLIYKNYTTSVIFLIIWDIFFWC
jgi:hypothetical protein